MRGKGKKVKGRRDKGNERRVEGGGGAGKERKALVALLL